MRTRRERRDGRRGGARAARGSAVAPIEDLLRKGQEILVQVSKESLGTKGARVTSFISIPGRYLVYMPQARHVGVSRRIHDDDERERLRDIVKGLRPPDGGFIVRTVAEGKGEEELAADIQFLARLWAQVQARFERGRRPSLLHEEMDLTFRVVRDLFSPEIEEFLVDSPRGATPSVLEFAAHARARSSPTASTSRQGRSRSSRRTGIEKEIEKALAPAGLAEVGRLHRHRPHRGAGRHRRQHRQVRGQARLRGDDPQDQPRGGRARSCARSACATSAASSSSTSSTWSGPSTATRCSRRSRSALADDKARTNVLEISELGLVEMTRKRVRQSLQSLFCAPCPTCKGSGLVKSDADPGRRDLPQDPGAVPATAAGAEVVIRVHPEMAHHLESSQGISRPSRYSLIPNASR